MHFSLAHLHQTIARCTYREQRLEKLDGLQAIATIHERENRPTVNFAQPVKEAAAT